MKKRKVSKIAIKITCIFLILYISFDGFAQTQWSLERCINYAIKNNLQIKQSIVDASISKSYHISAKNAYLPTVNATAEEAHTNRRILNFDNSTSNNNYYSTGGSINGTIDLFDGFQKQNNVKVTSLNLQAALMDVEKLKNDIGLAIASKYLNLLFLEEVIKYDSSQIKETNNQVERTKEMVIAGTKTQSYLFDIQTQQAQDNLTLVLDKANYRNTTIDLIQLLELKTLDNFSIEKPKNIDKLSPIMTNPFEKYYETAIELLPEIKSAIFRQKSAQSGINYLKGYSYPRLTFTASVGSNYLSYASLYGTTAAYRFSSQLSNNLNFYTGLSLRIPIFDGFQTRNAVRNAKYNEEKASNNIELVSRQIYKDVQKAYNNAISSKEKVTSSKVLLDATELSLSYITDRLTVGAVSVYDYSQIKTKLAKTNSDYLQAKYEYIFNVMILDFYNGKSLSIQNNN